MYYEILSDMEQCLLCIVIMFLAFVTLHRMLQTIWFHMPVQYILFSVCVFGISLIYFEGACVVIEHISDPAPLLDKIRRKGQTALLGHIVEEHAFRLVRGRMGQVAPDFLCGKAHDGSDQSCQTGKYPIHGGLCSTAQHGILPLAVQAILDNIQVEAGHIHHAEVVDGMEYNVEIKGIIEKLIGKSLEAKLTVACRFDEDYNMLSGMPEALRDICIVSDLHVIKDESLPTDTPFAVTVEKAVGDKCERCWAYSETVGTVPEHPTLCARCAGVVK